MNLLQGRLFFSDCSPVGTRTVLLTKKQQKLAGFRILTGTATTHDIITYVAWLWTLKTFGLLWCFGPVVGLCSCWSHQLALTVAAWWSVEGKNEYGTAGDLMVDNVGAFAECPSHYRCADCATITSLIKFISWGRHDFSMGSKQRNAAGKHKGCRSMSEYILFRLEHMSSFLPNTSMNCSQDANAAISPSDVFVLCVTELSTYGIVQHVQLCATSDDSDVWKTLGLLYSR